MVIFLLCVVFVEGISLEERKEEKESANQEWNIAETESPRWVTLTKKEESTHEHEKEQGN